jgi:GTP cyclohydrolase I
MSQPAPLHDPRSPLGLEPLAGDIEDVLRRIGEDPRREGLVRTPMRVAESLRFLTSGYEMSLDDIVGGAVFAEPYEEMVLVKDIELYSLCEHHMLPFFGKAHVAYLPRGRIVGLSKVARCRASSTCSRGGCRCRNG